MQLGCSTLQSALTDYIGGYTAKVSNCPTTYQSSPLIPSYNLQNLVAEFEISKGIDMPSGSATINYVICAYNFKSKTHKPMELNTGQEKFAFLEGDDYNLLKIHVKEDLKKGNANPSATLRREKIDKGKEGVYINIDKEGRPMDESKPNSTFYQNMKSSEVYTALYIILEIITEKRVERPNLSPSPELELQKPSGIEI